MRSNRSLPRVVQAEDLARFTAVQLMDVMKASMALPQSAASAGNRNSRDHRRDPALLELG